MKLFKLIGDIFDVSYKAREIRQDAEKRKKSARFAVSSIVFSLLAFLFTLGGAFLVGFLSTTEGMILSLFVIIFIAVLFIGAIIYFIGALVRVIAQFTINRSAKSWIALVVFIAAIIASVIALFKFMG